MVISMDCCMSSKQNRLVLVTGFVISVNPIPKFDLLSFCPHAKGTRDHGRTVQTLLLGKGELNANGSEEKIKWFSLTLDFKPISIFSTCTTHLICFQVRLIPVQDRRSTLSLPRWPASQIHQEIHHI